MEDISFSTDNLINFSLDFKKLSGNLNLLYQHSRINSLNIENLNKNILTLTSTTQDLSSSLKALSSNVESLEIFKELSSNKQKNIETQLKYVEDQFSHSLIDLQNRLPDIMEHLLGELDRVRLEQKTNYNEIEKKFERNLKHSKTSALEAFESLRNEINSRQGERAETKSKEEMRNKEENQTKNKELVRSGTTVEDFEGRIDFIEKNLKRVLFEDEFQPEYDKEVIEKLKNQGSEEKTDMALEVNAKYLYVISEVAKLREMLRSFSNIPGEESLDLNVKYFSYSQRIANLENQFKELKNFQLNQQEFLKPIQAEENKSFELKNGKKPEKKMQKSNSISRLPRKSSFDTKPGNPIISTEKSDDLSELNKIIQEKVSFSQMEEFFKTAITQLASLQSLKNNIEERIFKNLETKNHLEDLKSSNENSIDHKTLDDKPDFKEIISSLNESLAKHQADTSSELDRISNEVKSFENKLNKFNTGIQVQDLRTQDLAKRVQVFEEFQQVVSEDLSKLQERFRKNTLKSSEELEKTLSHLQELEVIRNNIRDVMFKMNEGNRLHKRDYETIQELRHMLDSKTSREEIDQKVDKNELKKMFRTLAKKIDKLQSDVKNIEDVGVNESLKRNEEPLIVAKKYTSECLTCGRDISYQHKSVSRLPAQYKQLPGFSKILPVLSNNIEMNSSKRQKSERFSISMQDPESFPTLNSRIKN